jgi:hypothetical protein
VIGAVRAVACVLILVPVAGGVVACSGAAKTVIPAPSANASVERVARVYLRAAVAGDCDLTAELTLSHTWSWCSDPKLLAYRSVGRPQFDPASDAGRNEECVNFGMDTDGSSDNTIPSGWAGWGLCFVRTHVGWRLYDQGQG